MKKLVLTLLLSFGFIAHAAADEEGYAWDKFPVEKMSDMAALQHGAQLFVNYCLNCPSAAYMRYNRMPDIGLSDDEIKKNLLFARPDQGRASLRRLRARDAGQARRTRLR
jgi:ubiquinol-cytochrome c reductase cytochrome c1 subunit